MTATALQDALRTDKAALIAELKAAGCEVKADNAIRCAWHDDRTPSAGVYCGEDGAWRFKCQVPTCGVGGDIFDIRAKVRNISVADALKASRGASNPPPKMDKPRWPDLATFLAGHPHSTAYKYVNPTTGNHDLIVLRTDTPNGKKRISQFHAEGQEIVMGAPEKPWPIYNRSRLVGADRVVVVEGEKCVHALHTVGIVATTSPAGAGKASLADWSALAGQTVYVWPDNDETGIAHGKDVVAILEALNPKPSILWVDPTMLGLGVGGDVADVLETLKDSPRELRKATIEDILADAAQQGGASGLKLLIEDTISGKRKNEGWPWHSLTRLARALLPGTVTLICGDPGATKSFMALEAMAFWSFHNVPAAIYELEEDKPYHLNRALAQLAHNSELTNDEWVRENGDTARRAYYDHKASLDKLADCMSESPEKQVTIADLGDWVEKQVNDGKRIIAIDPLTAAAVSDKPWTDDLAFMMRAKAAVRRGGASLILVTHPKKGKRVGAPGLEDMAGGAAYSRFSQTVLWLESHHQFKTVQLAGNGALHSPIQINRTLHINKARNGRGAGMKLGFVFEPDSLRFTEQGVIEREVKDDQ